MNDVLNLLAGPSAAEIAEILAAFPVAEAPAARRPAERPCYRCGGSGRIPGMAHVENGRCFACS